MNGIVVRPGGGRKLITPAQEITFKVTGADGSSASVFEVVVPPGFDVGAHMHHNSEELFFVVEGELEIFAFEPEQYTDTETGWRQWKSSAGDQPVRATAGSVAFVPQGCPHAFANRTDEPARMIFSVNPSPAHEIYFDRLAEIFAAPGPPDQEAIEQLRVEHDITQFTPLRHDRPAPGVHHHHAEETAK